MSDPSPTPTTVIPPPIVTPPKPVGYTSLKEIPFLTVKPYKTICRLCEVLGEKEVLPLVVPHEKGHPYAGYVSTETATRLYRTLEKKVRKAIED